MISYQCLRTSSRLIICYFSGTKDSGAVAVGQSSKAGDIEGNVLLDVQPISVLPPPQPNTAETKGSGNEEATDAVAEPNTELIRTETDSSPAGKKRGAGSLGEGPYHKLQHRGFKIHRVSKPAFRADDGGEGAEEEEDQDTLGQTSRPPVTTADRVVLPLPHSGSHGVGGAGVRPESTATPQPDPNPSSSQARSSDAARTPSSSQSFLPPGPILMPGFEWLEKSLREMLNVGLGHDRLTYVDNVDPDHLLTHMAIKYFEVTFLLLCLY